MMIDGCLLKFNGFTPAESTRHLLQEKVTRLFEGAPSESSLETIIGYADNLFKGAITICSPAGHFFAEASDKKFKRLSEKLVEQIQQQLEQWKSERFLSGDDYRPKFPIYHGKSAGDSLWKKVRHAG